MKPFRYSIHELLKLLKCYCNSCLVGIHIQKHNYTQVENNTHNVSYCLLLYYYQNLTTIYIIRVEILTKLLNHTSKVHLWH